MKKPVISVITVCRNSVATLEETICSVLAQDYDLLDYVIIDGGSTDGTLDIIERYRSRLGCVVSEPDRGISDAFNKGIARAKGDIIGIINSDDIMLPGALQAVAEAYDGATDLYRGSVVIVNKATGFRGRENPSMKFPLAPFVIHCAHQGTFISADAYKRWGGYDIKFRYMMDFDLMTRMYQGGAQLKRVEHDIAEFRLGGVSTTNSIKKKRYDVIHVVTNNGGGRLRAEWFYLYMRLYDFAKSAFIHLFGLDRLKRLHYRHSDRTDNSATSTQNL